MNPGLLKTICYAVALAMGVVVIVTSIVAPLQMANAATLLAIGVAALGLAGLQK
jgi:hypothetical protein